MCLPPFWVDFYEHLFYQTEGWKSLVLGLGRGVEFGGGVMLGVLMGESGVRWTSGILLERGNSLKDALGCETRL